MHGPWTPQSRATSSSARGKQMMLPGCTHLWILHCRWLIMAEQLQLDGLKDAALAALREPHDPDFQSQMQAKVLDDDLAQLRVATLPHCNSS